MEKWQFTGKMQVRETLDVTAQKILDCQRGFSTIHFSILCGMLAGILVGLTSLLLRG